jgi:hypothetical protein
MPKTIFYGSDGLPRAKGLIPRDYKKYPVGCYTWAKPFDLPLIGKSEWGDRLELQKKNNARLSDIRNKGMDGQPIPSRDQNGKGYCWAHSTVSAMLLVRALNNQPYADLSAYAIACIIKHYQDQGGWGAESLEWVVENGCPTSEYWPQQSMSRSNDTPEMRANAKQNKITEWMDLEPGNQDQFVTCLLSNTPVVSDYNDWSHSVCAADIVSFNPLIIDIWNSWGNSWKNQGMGPPAVHNHLPDGAIAPRVIDASLI